MFNIKEKKNVIAERRLYLETEPGRSVRVLLGKPQKASAADSVGDFMLCPYQILGIGDEKVRVGGGVDAIQALQLTMAMIGAELHLKLNPQHGGNLRWDAGKEGDLGFPIPSVLGQKS
jgi:hypothetical protein